MSLRGLRANNYKTACAELLEQSFLHLLIDIFYMISTVICFFMLQD